MELTRSRGHLSRTGFDESIKPRRFQHGSTSWQRCRTHYAANLMAATPKSSLGWVKAMLHSIYDQPDAAEVHAQFDRVVEGLASKLPTVAEHLK